MHDALDRKVVDDMARESLQSLWPATAVVAWVWTALVMIANPRFTIQAWIALAIILAAIGLSAWQIARRPGLAVAMYVAGLTAAVTVICYTFLDPAAFFLYAIVILVVAMLSSARATWLTALISTGLTLGIGHYRLSVDWQSLAIYTGLILLVAMAAWISSRRLVTALAWALNMTDEAQRSAREAQDNRAKIQLALKNLDEAYLRLERTTEALMFAREAAEKAYRFKADFVANVSHELRTPLNLIVGFSEMMALSPESYGGVSLPRQYRGDMMAIYRSAKHLTELINDVLDLSQIEAGRLPLNREPADLSHVVREAVEMVRGWAEARQLQLEVELPQSLPTLFLDRTRIRQVLLNLLTNATRFTDQGWIRVRVQLGESAREIAVEVQDSGRGIPQQNLSRAFEAFGQMGSDREREGSGLGLAISHKFVELHGGRMWIQSEVGRGTLVGFAIPLPGDGRAAAPPVLTRTPAARAGSGRPVVVVRQDDPRVLSLLQRYLDRYCFLPGQDTSSASDIVERNAVAAVLFDDDQRPPAGDPAASFVLPAHIASISCPLPSMQRLGIRLGAVNYLTKPVTRERMLAALARLPQPPQTVLIVDDDPDMVRLLSRMIKADLPSTQVLETYAGAEAFKVALARQPDLVLLDLLMPDFNGYDFLNQVARTPALSHTRVIIVSARPLEQESAPLTGELRVSRAAGFTVTEALGLVDAVLAVLTQPASALPANAEALPGMRSASPA